jgi:ribosomal protein S18 acetylase RimI-like enzyme
MPDVTMQSASRFTLEQLSALFTASFEGYLFPIAQPVDALAARIRCEQIDLFLSRVLLVDDEPAGLCLLAQRGRRARVAAMGIVASRRGLGLGRALMDGCIAIARAAAADRLCLEVFAANRSALSLYESSGFARVRRLVGHARAALPPVAATDLRRTDLDTLAVALAAEPDREWPWQLSPHTLIAASPDAMHVHALGGEAFACLNPANPARLGLRMLYVVPSARRRGHARRLLSAIQSLHPGAAWEIPPLVPEEMSAAALHGLGFARTELHQLEMELRLGPT